MRAAFSILILLLSVNGFALGENTAALAGHLKSALEVKTWYYVNKNENEKLSALKNSKVKNVKAAIQRRYQIQKEKLAQVISYFEQIESADKKQIEQLKSLEKNLHAEKLQMDEISEVNKTIDSIIDTALSKNQTIPVENQAGNFVTQVLKPYLTDNPELSFTKINFLNNLEVGTHEVTQEEWFEVMGYNPSFFSLKDFCEKDFQKIGATNLCPSLPVENFDYRQIISFLNRLNSAGKQYRYRLLTKKEFMLIAKFIKPADKDLDNISWHYENAKGQTQPAGSKQKDKLGLYDILGNLYELVNAGTDSEKITADIKIESFGGSWLTRRYSIMPETFWTIGKDYTCFDIGVRLVREKIETEK